MNIDPKVKELLHDYYGEKFDGIFERLEEGMRQRGHEPDLIHRLLQEDDYVWRRFAQTMFASIYEEIERLDTRFKVITPESIIVHTVVVLKELYETRMVRDSN